jgi:cephalosporin hydroxylase
MLLNAALRETLAIMQRRIVDATKYRGVPALKCPLDLWTYTEILYDVRPTVLIEIGNFRGGTLLYLDDICRAAELSTRLIGVDIDHSGIADAVRRSDRITLIEGDAIQSVGRVRDCVHQSDVVMIIEDSSHEYNNTLSILDAYHCLVTVGSYLIVEDTICHHGLDVGPSPGPMEAVAAFRVGHPEFVSDESRSFGISWNETGFLKKH